MNTNNGQTKSVARLLAAAVIAFTLSALVHADFRTGWAAYERNDYLSAVQEFEVGASGGDAPSQNALGIMYANGAGVPKDEYIAVGWFRKAAEQGFAQAQSNLGAMYASGEGVPKDELIAVDWFRKAAEQGAASAQFSLGVMYEKGRGVPKDERIAVNWYRKAAEQGHASAQNNMAVCFEFGSYLSKQWVVAYALYNLAAANGDERSKENLSNLEARMNLKDLKRGQDLATKLSNSKRLLVDLDAYVRANPWREQQASLPKPNPTHPRPVSNQGSRPRCINPATGLAMTALDGRCVGVDVMGNPYGMKNLN